MDGVNPLEILENKALEEEKGEDGKVRRVVDLDDFVSEEESEDSESEEEDKRRKQRKERKKEKKDKEEWRTDEFGRRMRNQPSKKKYGKEDLKSKIKTNKKYELYKMRKKEYEKENKDKEEEGREGGVSNYELSAIDRMALTRERILKKHSENFIKEVLKSKDDE